MEQTQATCSGLVGCGRFQQTIKGVSFSRLLLLSSQNSFWDSHPSKGMRFLRAQTPHKFCSSAPVRDFELKSSESPTAGMKATGWCRPDWPGFCIQAVHCSVPPSCMTLRKELVLFILWAPSTRAASREWGGG